MTIEPASHLDNNDGGAIALAPDPILCPHCLRTADNGIKCQGICVADSAY
ncbi:hypothetical protein [Neosynechococcus sphagnicola]|nr:hypothetical protein [Neosynechococcus sphagnicola]